MISKTEIWQQKIIINVLIMATKNNSKCAYNFSTLLLN